MLHVVDSTGCFLFALILHAFVYIYLKRSVVDIPSDVASLRSSSEPQYKIINGEYDDALMMVLYLKSYTSRLINGLCFFSIGGYVGEYISNIFIFFIIILTTFPLQPNFNGNLSSHVFVQIRIFQYICPANKDR